MIEKKHLKSYVKMLDHKFRVKYNRAKVRQLEQKLSNIEDPKDLGEVYEDEFYDREHVKQQPIRHSYLYR